MPLKQLLQLRDTEGNKSVQSARGGEKTRQA